MDKKVVNSLDDLEADLLEQFGQLKLKQEKVGYVFDEKMLVHKNFDNNHVEKPERAMAIYMNIVLKGISEKLIRLPSEEIKEEDILRVHNKEYLQRVADLVYKSKEEKVLRSKTENSFRLGEDNYDNYYTYDSAKWSAGSLLSCCKSVALGKVDHAFAIIRPPGHHASSSKARGFCFFNNVAIAADYLIKEHNMKVVVLDWDVHHGDGTQEIFYQKSNPLQISIHRLDNGKFYPHKTGKVTELGEGEGKGFNLNIPWNTFAISNPKSSIGDAEYVYTFETIVIPVIKEYKPDVILVSCGFDAAENDPLGKMSVTPLGYAYMTHQLKKLSSKVILALEGGYNVNSLFRCSEAAIRTLLNDSQGLKGLFLNKELDDLNLNAFNVNKNLFSPSYYAIEQVNICKSAFESYWSCLKDVKTVTPNKNFFRKDNVEVLDKISKENNVSEFLLKEIPTNERIPDLLKFKIGKFTAPPKSTNDQKFIRRTLNDIKTLSRELEFRLEGISLNVASSLNERHFNWVKRDGIFDMTTKDVGSLASKFLSQKKVSKSQLIKSLEGFKATYEKFFLENKLDLFGVDIIIMTNESEESADGVKTRSFRKKLGSSKTEILLKLNGLKEYSLVETNSAEEDQNNFYQGLRSLIKFLDENIME